MQLLLMLTFNVKLTLAVTIYYIKQNFNQLNFNNWLYLSYIATAEAITMILGPAIGSFLYELFGFQTVFFNCCFIWLHCSTCGYFYGAERSRHKWSIVGTHKRAKFDSCHLQPSEQSFKSKKLIKWQWKCFVNHKSKPRWRNSIAVCELFKNVFQSDYFIYIDS